MASRVGSKGFTLVELSVVVLIIGILVGISIPQYIKLAEQSRATEAQAFIDGLRSAQESLYNGRTKYVTAADDLKMLEGSLPQSPPTYGLKSFSVALDDGISATCDDGGPDWRVTLTRLSPNSSPPGPGVSSRYGTYQVVYDRCQGIGQYQNCVTDEFISNCDLDFGGLSQSAMGKPQSFFATPPGRVGRGN